MKIKSIRLKNFKCLKDVSLKLSNLNLLTGINSAGKSSLIQSLLLVGQNMDQLPLTLKETLFESKNNNKNSSSLLDKLQLKGNYVDLGVPKSLLFEEAEDDSIEIDIRSEKSGIKLLCDLINSTSSDNLPCILKCEGEIFNLLKDGYFQYLNIERIGSKILYDYSIDIINKNNIGNHGEYTAHFLADKGQIDLPIESLRYNGTKTNQLMENTVAWLSRISKGIDIYAESKPDIKKVVLTYTYYNKTKRISPINVGFGITYVLPVITAILKSKPDDLLIIENPESHLHPAGQAEIGRLCAIAAQAGVQIIVETHSDHFLNGVRVAAKQGLISPDKAEIFYFERKKDKLDVDIHNPKLDKKGRIDQWPCGFFDEWDNQLDKLLW